MKIFAPLRAAAKTTTNLVGIPVNPNARTELLNLYKRIDNALSRLPETSGYRVGTKSLIQDRLQLLQTTSSDAEFETKVGLGQMEELILQAEGEIKLMSKMEKEQVWEPLVQVAPVGQWNQ